MTTRELIAIAKTKGITIKELSKITQINISTLYHFNGGSNLSKEKEEKLYNTLLFLLDKSQ